MDFRSLTTQLASMTETLTALHPLDQAAELEALAPGRYAGATSPGYWNMAGPFGGATAAVLLKAVLNHPERRGRPVAQTVNFCAAIGEGAFEIAVRLVRDGRSTQHWQVELVQGETVAATASLVTGPSRETWGHQPTKPPAMPPPAEIEPMPTAGRNAWLSRYEFRFERGAPVFGQAAKDEFGSALSRLWIRDEPPRPLDYVSLAALADTFVIRLVQVRGDLPPVATVSLSTYFLADEAEMARQGPRPLIGVADARVFKHGFNDQSAELWSDDGALLAVSHQVVWFKS
jgi:acyl-CoA thioesterase